MASNLKYKLTLKSSGVPYASGDGCFDVYDTLPDRYLIFDHGIGWVCLDFDDNKREYRFRTKRELLKFINS